MWRSTHHSQGTSETVGAAPCHHPRRKETAHPFSAEDRMSLGLTCQAVINVDLRVLLNNCPAHTAKVITCEAGEAGRTQKIHSWEPFARSKEPWSPGGKLWLSLHTSGGHREVGVDSSSLRSTKNHTKPCISTTVQAKAFSQLHSWIFK